MGRCGQGVEQMGIRESGVMPEIVKAMEHDMFGAVIGNPKA